MVRPDHPRASSRRLPAAVLAEETFLVREPGSGTRNLMERFFAEAHVTPRIGMEMASNETIKQAVMAGLGIAFLSAHTVSAELADRRLVLLDLVGLPVVRQWFIVRLARRRLLPAAQALRQFLIDEGQQFLPQLPQKMSQNRQPARASAPDSQARRPKVPGMQIEVMDFVDGARKARGVAVIIDVFRAFSVACYAYARGAKRIIPMAGIEESLALKRAHPEYVAIGERERAHGGRLRLR